MMYVGRYKILLEKAMGSYSQKDFAKKAGISPFSLNRMLNMDEDENREDIPVPRKSTLKKIASASEGRVSEEQLYSACGYEFLRATITKPEENPQQYCLQEMNLLKDGLSQLSGTAMRYGSVCDFLYAVKTTHGIDKMVPRCFGPQDYNGVGHKNAEAFENCHFLWRRNGLQAIFSFTVFFCKTEKGGCIISDVVFDLASLLELEHRDAGKFMFELAEKGDVVYSEVPYVFTCRPYNAGEAEKRLLKAIFGEDSND